jgi:ADP-ribose pyrophosphatase YjhB (NUDIX family)
MRPGNAVKDHFALVAAFYGHINDGDITALERTYDPSVITERLLFEPDAQERHTGRESTLGALREYFARYRGGFDGGAHYRVRTIGGIQTGWGWVHAEWLQSAIDRVSGARHEFSGYSHFLVEEGLIRRHRSAREALAAGSSRDDERPARADAATTRTYPPRPIVGVGAVVLVDGRVVLVKRRHEPLAGQWSLPGGTLELGETLEAGVAREVLEETGLVVDVGPLLEVFDRIVLDETRRVRYHFVLVDYLCRTAGGTLASASDASDVTLADPLALEPYHLAPKVSDVIAMAIEKSHQR